MSYAFAEHKWQPFNSVSSDAALECNKVDFSGSTLILHLELSSVIFFPSAILLSIRIPALHWSFSVNSKMAYSFPDAWLYVLFTVIWTMSNHAFSDLTISPNIFFLPLLSYNVKFFISFFSQERSQNNLQNQNWGNLSFQHSVKGVQQSPPQSSLMKLQYSRLSLSHLKVCVSE